MTYSREQLPAVVVDYATAYGIDPSIALAQLKRESANFRPDVVYGPFVGAAGERGIAQFTPGTWARFGSGDPYNPDDSLRAWGDYMTWLLARYGGDYSLALQGYNGGEGHVDQGRVSSAAQTYAREILAAAQSTPISAGPPDSLPAVDASTSSSLTPLLIGAGAFLLILYLSD